MKRNLIYIAILLIFCNSNFYGQNKSKEGNLFIIGGGNRPPSLIESMLSTAALGNNDYIVILPMASSIPDTVVMTIKNQMKPFTSNTITDFDFEKDDVQNEIWIDSLKNARLIYITGGDQNKFMDIVRDSPVQTAIQTAFKNGSTIAGTSAGAAVMSKIMITGKQISTQDYSDFEVIRNGNLVSSQGLGLLENAIIDQHFITRGRFNRLITALAQYPDKICIGIDESTAIIYHNNKARVIGESQVVILSNIKKLSVTSDDLIKFQDLRFSLMTENETFKVN